MTPEWIEATVRDVLRYRARGERSAAEGSWWLLVACVGSREASRLLEEHGITHVD